MVCMVCMGRMVYGRYDMLEFTHSHHLYILCHSSSQLCTPPYLYTLNEQGTQHCSLQSSIDPYLPCKAAIKFHNETLCCNSHLVWLVFQASVPTCACFHSEKKNCDLFLPFFCLFCFEHNHTPSGKKMVTGVQWLDQGKHGIGVRCTIQLLTISTVMGWSKVLDIAYEAMQKAGANWWQLKPWTGKMIQRQNYSCMYRVLQYLCNTG